jgi:hypothetical protein
MAINDSPEKRNLAKSQHDDQHGDQHDDQHGDQHGLGELPVVVFVAVAISLWAIAAMVIGQTLGRVINLAFPFVGIAAMVITLATLGHGFRRTMRVVVTIGDVVSVAITGVLAFAARGLIDWPFLAPLTVADDAARHFGMVNWIAAHHRLPNAPTPDLLQFSEYPMSAHYLAATIARTFGMIPLRVANMMAVGVTYGMWIVLGSATAFALCRIRQQTPRWQQALAATTVPLVGYTLYTLTLWAVTASYFYAQVIGLWFACVVTALVLTNADRLLGGSTFPRFRQRSGPEFFPNEAVTKLGGQCSPSLRSRSRRIWGLRKENRSPWWPMLATLMLGPSLVYPLHLMLTAGVVCAVVLIERRLISSAIMAILASMFGLAIQLRWLGAATKMSQEEGSILRPTLANLGGLTVAILLAVGLVWAVRTKTFTVGALTVVLGAAQVGVLALGHQFGAVSEYTVIKVISSLTPGLVVMVAIGAVLLGQKLQELCTSGFVSSPQPGNSWRLAMAPGVAAFIIAMAMIEAIRFPPLTGLTRPLVSADGYRVTRWASKHVDPNQVGIVAPGIEAYSLWWTALDRKKDLTILRNMQPASNLWSEWPAKGAERYLIVVTEGQAASFARRVGVKVLFRSGSAVVLERTK